MYSWSLQKCLKYTYMRTLYNFNNYVAYKQNGTNIKLPQLGAT